MEDYDNFIQHQLSQLKKTRECNENQLTESSVFTRHGSSAICFRGSPILPPLLSGEQRAQMRGHREEAVWTSREKPRDPRMFYVQTVLQSVQLRRAPTLEEFFQGEPGMMFARSANFHEGTDHHVQALLNDVAMASLPESVSPLNRTLMPDGKSDSLVQAPGLTSTRASQQPETRTWESLSATRDELFGLGCVLEDDPGSRTNVDLLADVSHQSASSGYVTYENTEAVGVSGRAEARGNLGSGPGGSPIGGSTGCFFLHSLLDTNATKACAIISHPPVNAEDLDEGPEAGLATDWRSYLTPLARFEGALAGVSSPVHECHHLCITPRSIEDLTGNQPRWEEEQQSSLFPPDLPEPGTGAYPQAEASTPDLPEPGTGAYPQAEASTPDLPEPRTGAYPQAEASTPDLPEPGTGTCPQAEASSPDLPEPGTGAYPQAEASTPDLPEPRTGAYPQAEASTPDLLEPGTGTCPQAEASSPDHPEPGQNPHYNPLHSELDQPNGPYRLSLQTLLKKSSMVLNLPQPVRNQPESSPNSRSGCINPDPDPGAPYRLSLQTLLKKSQEHRRHQRQLKNQAKSGSTGPVRTGESATRPQITEEEEHGFSDKENEEFSRSGGVPASPGMKTAGRDGRKDPPEMGVRSAGPQLPEKIQRDAWVQPEDDEDKSGMEGVARSEGKPFSEGIMTEGESGNGPTPLEDSQTQSPPGPGADVELRLTPDYSAAPPQPIVEVLRPTPTGALPSRERSHVGCPPKPSPLRVGKYGNVPSPQFCMSPVRCQGKVACVGVGRATARQRGVGAPLDVASEAGSRTGLGGSSSGARGDSVATPTAPLAAGGGMRRRVSLGRGASVPAEQIAQLELNLSSLRTLISDLESTLTESPGNSRPTDDVDSRSKHMDDQMLADYRGNLAADPFPKFCDGGVRSAGGVRCSDGEAEASVPGYGRQGGRQRPPASHRVTSLTQKMRVADVFRKAPNCALKVRSDVTKVTRKTPASVLSEAGNIRRQPISDRISPGDPTPFLSVNESYDVETPSGLWLRGGSGSEGSVEGHYPEGKQLTPEDAGGGLGGVSRAKRRLVMQETEGSEGGEGGEVVVRPQSCTPQAAVRSHGQETQRLQLKEAHVAQVRALKEEQRRQQQQLLQTLSMRYQQLQSLSFPVSSQATSNSCPGDEKTSLLPFSYLAPSYPSPGPCFPENPCSSPDSDSPSQPVSGLSVQYRPLVAAAVKGFLTRRLLRTERVSQLLRTIKDTQQFLRTSQNQTPGRQNLRASQTPGRQNLRASQTPGRQNLRASQTPGREFTRQDQVLLERVTLQLRSARYEVQDIFFCLPPGERMKIISRDRQRIREIEMRRKTGQTVLTKSSLSSATLKALERKTETMTQRKAVEERGGTGIVAGSEPRQRGPPAGAHESNVRPKRGSLRPNPQRVPKHLPPRKSR